MIKLSKTELSKRNSIQMDFLNNEICMQLGNWYFSNFFIKKYFKDKVEGQVKLRHSTVFGSFYDPLSISIYHKRFDENDIDVRFSLGIKYGKFETDPLYTHDGLENAPYVKISENVNILIKPILDGNYSETLAQIKKKNGDILIINEVSEDVEEMKENIYNIFRNEHVYIIGHSHLLKLPLPDLAYELK